jgi:3'-phosphoadenosine 5'-phosphosulfate sulfotransferase (PAPS reductase)/FAD synthetase
MLHLALKAFCPAKPPFPQMHADTTRKFRDIYGFRERRVREVGMDLIVTSMRKAWPRASIPLRMVRRCAQTS